MNVKRTLVSILFSRTLTFLILVGSNGGRGEIKMASASTSTPSANEQAKDAVLVHKVQLKPIIKAQISGRMISSGISDSDRFSILRENPSEEVDY